MNMRQTYSYVVLRYVHDVGTGESLNLGVALLAPGADYFGVKVRTSIHRITAAFPGANGTAIRRKLRTIQRVSTNARIKQSGLFGETENLAEVLAYKLLPKDDSSLQWANAGSGITTDPEKALEHLFARLVVKYDHHVSKQSRSDDDVWKVFSNALEKRRVVPHLVEKKIVGTSDEVRFPYAWKNGIWHCFEPLSFDLVDAESIKAKAHRWLGQLSMVKDASETFKVYFLIGEPSGLAGGGGSTADSKVALSYETARAALAHVPVPFSVFTESQADDFSLTVEQELSRHSASR